ncbi:Dabb family protein [uncultured Cyclobacterium sp.]|uniref:Dabb family protein n=1 Tax=uncultured Cyclobacterium sp. TaxID=453820 RepID=UPI0030EF3184
MIVHQVFFWLHKPEKDLNAVLEGCKEIAQAESVKSYAIGKPAATEKREVIDDSYDIALMVNFESIADHDLYQEDPIHLKFIKDHKDKWASVKIYDFEV